MDEFENQVGQQEKQIVYQHLPNSQANLDKGSSGQATQVKEQKLPSDLIPSKIGSDQDGFFYGIEKKIYQKNLDNKHVSKTGTDFQLLPQNPQFIMECDPFEPLYVPKQDVLENSLRREIEKFCFADTLMNRIVFDCVDASVYTKDQDPKQYNVDVLPFYIPTSLEDTTLVFESRFECGNLRRAIQISEFEYNIILKPDYFTQGNTQWYYFSLANTRKNQEYRFNIINMMKPDSLYNAGMKPLVYSQNQAKEKQIGWYRDGYDICYYQNNMKRKSGGYYYTLTFSVKFASNHDQAYLSHCYPYTYAQLCTYLINLEKDQFRKNKVKKKILCQTIAGNEVPVLTITEFIDGKNENTGNKKAVVLTSRIHPGESMASYIIENIIDFLTGQSIEAKTLRENFVFKVIPMLNIDGVINGNYRCNLAGVDLNRQWMYPQKSQHPSIYYTKMLIKKMKEEKNLVFFCDFHGHSRKKNIFMYGCSGKDPNRREMVFPLLMRNNCSVLSFKDCNFAIQKDREGSARIAIWKEFSLNNCYTLELSFCGADCGKYEYFHFNFEIFREIAQSFCHTLIDCFEPDQIKVRVVLEEIDQIIQKSCADKNKNVDSSEGVDSDYSNDEDKRAGANAASATNDKEVSNNATASQNEKESDLSQKNSQGTGVQNAPQSLQQDKQKNKIKKGIPQPIKKKK